MAKFEVITTPEEQQKVVDALRTVQGSTLAVAAIATLAKMSQSRVRYVIADLEEAGRIKRVPTKAYNPHYIRYSYEVLS